METLLVAGSMFLGWVLFVLVAMWAVGKARDHRDGVQRTPFLWRRMDRNARRAEERRRAAR